MNLAGISPCPSRNTIPIWTKPSKSSSSYVSSTKGAPAYGVALAAIARGYDRLTRAQRGLFDRVIAPALATLVASRKTAPPSSAEAPRHPAGNPWKPIREAPGDRDVQLGIKDGNEISPLAFACRRVGTKWVQSENSKPMSFRATHWRGAAPWRGRFRGLTARRGEITTGTVPCRGRWLGNRGNASIAAAGKWSMTRIG